MERDHTVYRSLVADNVERLNVARVIMLHGYDATDCYLVEVLSRHWVLEVEFVDAVSLLGYGTRYYVPQSSESVRCKCGFVSFI